jgi:hypothetical protein
MTVWHHHEKAITAPLFPARVASSKIIVGFSA